MNNMPLWGTQIKVEYSKYDRETFQNGIFKTQFVLLKIGLFETQAVENEQRMAEKGLELGIS